MGDASTEIARRGYRKLGGSSTNSLQILKHTFPHVDKSLVFNIWMASSQDKVKAESRLIQLGYRPVGNRVGAVNKSPYHTSSNTSPHRHQQKGHSSRDNSPLNHANRNNINLSPHHSGSPSRSPRQVSPKRSYSPNKSSSSPKRSPSPSAYQAGGPNETEKERLYEKFVGQFPNQPTSVIAAALEVCCYNEMQTLAVLQASLDTDNRPQPKPATSPAPVRQQDARSSHPKSENKLVSYDPVSLSDRSDKSPSSASSVRDMSSCKSPEDKDSPERISNMPSVIHDSPSKHPASQARAKQVTSTSETVVTSEKQVYISPYRLKAKGPDTSLRHGPDDKNLLPSYLGVRGPNRENYRGPDFSLAKGPMKSHGPDAINRCGPLRSLQGQDPILVTKL